MDLLPLTPECWRPVPGHTGYDVSCLGRVRNAATGRVLRPHSDRDGYQRLHLGRGYRRYVHQLVAAAWHGPCPPGHEVDHEDFTRANNTPGNLRYMPKVANAFRWAAKHQEPPPDHAPLTPDEEAELDAQLAAAGW